MRFCKVEGAESFWCEVERNLDGVEDAVVEEEDEGSSRRRRR